MAPEFCVPQVGDGEQLLPKIRNSVQLLLRKGLLEAALLQMALVSQTVRTPARYYRYLSNKWNYSC